jgi:hypothetical protein
MLSLPPRSASHTYGVDHGLTTLHRPEYRHDAENMSSQEVVTLSVILA